MKRIVITGPESTGKTELCQALSEYWNCPWVPELAREYVQALDRPYTFQDLEIIAKGQEKQMNEAGAGGGTLNGPFVFFDTWLIVTRVWFDEVFGRVPLWIDPIIAAAPVDLYLLCSPDIPWVYDPLRENPHRRDYLFNRYMEEIRRFGFPVGIVSGMGDDRLKSALGLITEVLQLD